MRSKKLHFHALRTSDQDKKCNETQAWRGSGRPPKCDTELSEASEGEVEGHSSRKEEPAHWHRSMKDHGVSEELNEVSQFG